MAVLRYASPTGRGTWCGTVETGRHGYGVREGIRERRLDRRPRTRPKRDRKTDTYSRAHSSPELGDTAFRLKLAIQEVWSVEKAEGLMGIQLL